MKLRSIQTLAAAAAVLLAANGNVDAQISSAQQSALRANCRSDFMSKCSGVTPGGKDALVCLQKNVETLSPGCKSAVSATLPAPPAPVAATPAPAPAPKTEASAPPPAPAPQPVAAATPASPAPAATPAAPPPAPSAAAPAAPKPPQAPKPAAAARPAAPKTAAVAAPAAPTPTQQDAIRSACRSDFMSKCSGVAPGGKDALACLRRNATTLSPACRTAVSAATGAPAAAAAVATPAATDPAPSITPEQMKAVRFTCRTDFGRYCKGVAPGGPEALGCLQSNASRLTPDCRTSLAAIADEVPAATTAAAAPADAAHKPRLPGITPAGRVLRRVIERVEEKPQQ